MRSFVCILTAGLLAAAAPPASAQTVDELVARHIEARGGYQKLKAIQTIKITRTVATPFSDVRVIVYKKRPNLYRGEQGPVQAGAVLTARAVNGDVAWDTGPGGKVTARPAASAAETREIDGDFDGLLVDWKEKGHSVTLDGREKLASGETYKLKVKTKSGVERTLYLDAATCLERRQTGVLNLPGGRQFNAVIDFDNYREVGGVKFAHDINEERTGQEPVQSLVTYTEKIELDVPMDDGLFAMPGVK